MATGRGERVLITLRDLLLLAALLAFAIIIFPIAATSVAKSVSESNDSPLTQFVGP